MLRLDEDLAPLYALTDGDARLAYARAHGVGRLLRAPTAYEDVIKMLLTTNCTWSLTRIMVGAPHRVRSVSSTVGGARVSHARGDGEKEREVLSRRRARRISRAAPGEDRARRRRRTHRSRGVALAVGRRRNFAQRAAGAARHRALRRRQPVAAVRPLRLSRARLVVPRQAQARLPAHSRRGRLRAPPLQALRPASPASPCGST